MIQTLVLKQHLTLLIPFLVLVSCSYYSPIYWNFGEWNSPDVTGLEDYLIVYFDWAKQPGTIASIDGNILGTGYKKARLSPGKHVIEFADYPVEFGKHPKGKIEIELMAGHSYEFNMKYCFWCTPRRYAVWVKDKTINEKVWGELPNWPSWYL